MNSRKQIKQKEDLAIIQFLLEPLQLLLSFLLGSDHQLAGHVVGLTLHPVLEELGQEFEDILCAGLDDY